MKTDTKNGPLSGREKCVARSTTCFICLQIFLMISLTTIAIRLWAPQRLTCSFQNHQFVPEARSKLAQRFSAGMPFPTRRSPGGTTLSHTYASNRVHVIFSTKHRKKNLAPEIQSRLWAYMSGIARNHGFEALKIGGVEDHVHALLVVPPNMPVSKAVQMLKGSSSKHINESITSGGFNWQEGYAAFSVSCSQTQSVVDYIANQTNHHSKQTYDEEFLEFLKKHCVTYDAAYVFG
jgi:putative transposase